MSTVRFGLHQRDVCALQSAVDHTCDYLSVNLDTREVKLSQEHETAGQINRQQALRLVIAGTHDAAVVTGGGTRQGILAANHI
jgi:hypothetical protein